MMRKRPLNIWLLIMVAVSIIWLNSPLAAGAKNSIPERNQLKIYISVDMEGIWGVVHTNQCLPDSPEYQVARKWMTEDVNAVIQGLFEAGATEVVVNDSHGSMRNIIASDLDPRAELLSGSRSDCFGFN